MSLPNLPAGDKFRREVRTEWGGLNLNENAGDGELIEARNMSSREFPVLSTEHLSKERATLVMDAIYSYAGKLGYEYNVGGSVILVDPTRTNHEVSIGNQLTRQFATLGERMILLGNAPAGVTPTKKIYDFGTGTVSDMEASVSGTGAWFGDGTYGGVAAENNTINLSGADWGSKFNVGDAVTITGCRDPYNNKTAIIREIDGDNLRFYENTFADGWYTMPITNPLTAQVYGIGSTGKTFTLATAWNHTGVAYYKDGLSNVELEYISGNTIYSMTVPIDTTVKTPDEILGGADALVDQNSITVSRDVPDMDFICVNENRVWGCKGDTIYASKLGDPLNWNVFDDLSTDSWTAETGTDGAFTGCCSFQGYPTFFKENAVYKILGDVPKNFVLRRANISGVKSGCDKTIVEIRGKLYYMSGSGIMEWNGGDYPAIISGALSRMIGQMGSGSYDAGTDSIRYFIELAPYQFVREIGWWVPQEGVFVYDPRFGTWHMLAIANETVHNPPVMFTGDGAHNWMVKDWQKDSNNVYMPYIYKLHSFNSGTDKAITWTVTFADSTRAYKTALTGSESKKGVLRLLIRCRLAGSMKVWIAYDGGDFEEAGTFGGENGMDKGSRVVPLILRRCDFWQLRLTGTGDAVIYSIAVERYGGEWQQA